jgi:recombination protein RecT
MAEAAATTPAQPAPQQKPPIVVLRERLIQRREEIKAALTDIPVDQFIRAVMTSVALNPDILACSWQSVWLSCMRACRDGLLPDGIEGAIVPFKGTASFIPMYRGLLRQFRRSGQFKWVTAGLVREGEEFTHFIDETGEHFRHVPGESFAAKIAKVYALATTKDGGVFVSVMTIEEANKIKAFSKNTREDGPWKQWPEEMYKKGALRRLSKVLPSSRDVPLSLLDDDEASRDVAAVLGEPSPPLAIEQQQPIEPEGKAGGVGATLDQFAGEPKQAKAINDDRGGSKANNG